MASNFSNFFFTAFSERFGYDEFVFGPNTMTGSGAYQTVLNYPESAPPATGTWSSNVTWSPTSGTITAAGIVLKDKTVLSPVHHGFFGDVIGTPPERYLWSDNGKSTPPIYTPLASGSSYELSINRDIHSRIFSRFLDSDANDESLFDGTFTPLS